MHDLEPDPGPALSRRAFARAAMGGAAALALPAHAATLPFGPTSRGDAASGGTPVVGFHADTPWLDTTGRDKPYHPPVVTGRFAPDTESLMRLGYFL